MVEYIERKAALKWTPTPKSERVYESENLDDAWESGYNDALGKIESIPAADVRPVVHGNWIYDCERTAHDGWTYRQYHCDKCGGEVIGGPYDYCHFCGADMR